MNGLIFGVEIRCKGKVQSTNNNPVIGSIHRIFNFISIMVCFRRISFSVCMIIILFVPGRIMF